MTNASGAKNQLNNLLSINRSECLTEAHAAETRAAPFDWVTENTAILVVHGIGSQLPMETLDQFGRGFIEAYRKRGGHPDDYLIEHVVVEKEEDRGAKGWLDNVLRVRYRPAGEDAPYIDIYEYYWANHTEIKADWNDINE